MKGKDHMKAFVVARYGKNEVRAADVPEPRVGNSDVLVRVSAASINPLDIMVRNGEFKQLLKYKTPFVLGHDVAGVVTRSAPTSAASRSATRCLHAPATFASGPSRSTSPSTIMTSRSSRHPVAARGRGGPVGRAGRVADPGRDGTRQARAEGSRPRRHRRAGSTVIQLAKHLGAHVATTANGAREELVRDLGADVVIDYTKQDFRQILSDYDVVVDSLGGDNLHQVAHRAQTRRLAIGVTGPPDAGFAKQLGAPKPFEFVLSFLSRKVRKAAKKLGVRY